MGVSVWGDRVWVGGCGWVINNCNRSKALAIGVAYFISDCGHHFQQLHQLLHLTLPSCNTLIINNLGSEVCECVM